MFVLQNGLVFLENVTLEIHPVPRRLHSRLMMRDALLEDNFDNTSVRYPHIVRRTALNTQERFSTTLSLPVEYRPARKVDAKRIGKLTVEVALFFDEVGYSIFAPYFNYDTEKIRDMLLAYLNGVSL